MIRRIFRLQLFPVLFLLFSNFIVSREVPLNLEELPDLEILTTNGRLVNLQEVKGKIILILFMTGCDHCQREAKEIGKHWEKFKGYTLYFVSSDELYKIDQFANDFELSDKPLINLGFIDPQVSAQTFGQVQTPALFIYNQNRKLMKRFLGETNIDQIIGHL
jgi:peroxiredoxin